MKDWDAKAVLWQFWRIVGAFLISSLVTGYVVTLTLLWYPGGAGDDARQGFLGFGLMVSIFIVYFAALPVVATVGFGEFLAWRMWWYYALAGAVIGLILGLLFKPPDYFPWLGLGFGPVSGIIYWAVAGRHAGLAQIQSRKALAVIFAGLAVASGAVSAINHWY